MLGLYVFSFHAENTPSWKNKNKKKRFFVGFLKNIFKILKNIYDWPICIEPFICLSTFQKTFSDPKSDNIYLHKIAVEILGL